MLYQMTNYIIRLGSSEVQLSPPTQQASDALGNHYADKRAACGTISNSSSRYEGEDQVPLLSNGQMREAHLGSHTISSHGIQVARFHMHDWLILLLLIILDAILNIINPFYRFVGQEMMSDLKYPLKSNTVPFWAVPVIAIIVPMAIFLLYYVYRRDVYDFHHAILGLLFSVLVTAVITDAIKDAVGRPRPDFFWRCFPDGNDVYNPITKGVICHGSKSVIKEGHKSFPSGHTSWSFAGLGFLSLYLSGKIKAFDRNGHVAKLCIVFLPLLVAALVGISRVDDYWHHWQDVFAGGILGSIVAIFCYLQFFPAPYDADGWGPYAYFQMLAESGNVLEQAGTADAVRVQRSETETLYQQVTEHAGALRMHGNIGQAV